MKTKSLSTSVMMNLVSQIGGILIPLITFSYVARVLMPEGLGRVSFAQSLVGYFAMFASLGIPLYGVRESAKCRDSRDGLLMLAVELFILNVIIMAMSYLAFGIFMKFSDKTAGNSMLFLICSIPMLVAPLGFDWFLKGMEDYVFLAVQSIVLRLTVLILILAFVRDSGDYLVYALIASFNVVAANISAALFSRKYLSFKDYKAGGLRLRRHVKPVLLVSLTAFAYKIYAVTDKVMLGYMSTTEEIGYYAASQRFLAVAVGVVVAFVSVLIPRASYNQHTSQRQEHDRITIMSFTLLSVVSAFGMGEMYICSGYVIDLFCGKLYASSSYMLQIASVSLMAITFYHFVLYQILYPAGKDIIVCVAISAGVVANIILNYFFIPTMLGVGASWATLVSQFVICAFVALWLLRYESETLRNLGTIFVRHIIMAAVSGLAAIPIIFLPTRLYSVATRTFISACVYALVFILLLLLSEDSGLSIILDKTRGLLRGLFRRGEKI